MSKKNEYVVETSAVLAAIGQSSLKHNLHFRQTTSGCRALTSVYIRKEFIQGFIGAIMKNALKAALSSDTSDALIALSQSFQGRHIKINVIALASLIKTRMQVPSDSKEFAIELARIAVNWLKEFDNKFKSKIPNMSQCKIGQIAHTFDYNDLLNSCSEFCTKSDEKVLGCPVNNLIGLRGKDQDGKRLCSSQKTSHLKPVENLAELLDKKSEINCTQCKKIGDVVIALEQPSDKVMLHIDDSFDVLCEFLNRKHSKMLSVSAAEKLP